MVCVCGVPSSSPRDHFVVADALGNQSGKGGKVDSFEVEAKM